MAPPLPESVGSFDCLFEFEYESVPVSLFRCRETGLRVALAKVLSPTVHGYFAIQTEAFDDYGCPHTLEHLVFLGSERYPYKGVLDVLANRCLAQGTNAWTDTDHTCYTVDTAGSEGFLNILPVYLDHVLFPTLTDSGFVTEIHHINGEGADAGVVYCEMQARENEEGDMVDRALKLAAYPGRCSYKSETGGRLKELRELTNKQVRDYHKAYYRPENLCVIVTGQVDAAALCKAAAPVIESIRQSERIKSLPKFSRPFSSEVPKPSEKAVSCLDFPAEDEKNGAVCKFAWHGPKWDELETITALEVLGRYMTKDSVAPLRKALVETEPPLCGNVHVSLLEQSVYLLYISLRSVSVDELSKRDVDKEVTSVLEAFAANEGSGIDMERMRSVVQQMRRQHLSSVEESPHDLYSGELIGAFLYAPSFAPDAKAAAATGDALRARLDKPAMLAKLLDWTATRWADLCKRWLLNPDSNPRITVIGKPSKSCGEKIQEEDANRIKAQKEKLGEAGCKLAGEAVDKAEEENDVDTPDEVAQSFQLPDISKINLIDVSTIAVDGVAGTFKEVFGKDACKIKSLLESAGSAADLPRASMQFDHVAGAQFVDCQVMLPLDGVTQKQLVVLPLWIDVAFSLPLSESDTGPALDYESAVKAIDDVTVSKGCSVGSGGGRFAAGAAANMLFFTMRVEKASYAEAPRWLARVLADAVFDAERLRIAAKRILNDVPNMKRNGRALMRLALRAMSYRDDGTMGALNAFRMEQALEKMLKKGKGVDEAIAALCALRKRLLGAVKIIRVAGDIAGLSGGEAVFAPWRRAPWVAPKEVASAKAKLPTPALSRELFAKGAVRPRRGATAGCLVSSSAEESNYWTVQAKCFTDPRSPELAPLAVAIEYLTALEGPFWRKIRGKGLSYSYSLSNSLESGMITFGLFKANEPITAFKQAAIIVQKLCAEGGSEPEPDAKTPEPDAKTPAAEDVDDGTEDGEDDEDEIGLDPTALEAAQSGVLFGLIEPVDTVPSAMDEVFSSMLSRQPPDQLQWMLKEVQAVTEESVQAAMRKYILPLFDGKAGRIASLMCPAKKCKEVQKELRKLQPPFKVCSLSVDELVSTLSPADGYAKLREEVAAAAQSKKEKAKANAKAAVGMEKRIDPEDGLAYTWEEISAHYARKYKKKDIEAYWSSMRLAAVRAVGDAEERRVDPKDGVAYTYAELSAYYKGTYSKKALRSYWDAECWPAAQPQAKAKAKAKAKVKAKAKPSKS